MIRDKILRLYTIVLIFGTIRFGIYYFINDDFKVMIYGAIFIFTTILPFLLNRFLNTRLSNTLIFIYITFSFCATLLGGGFELYHLLFWWDTFVHLFSGILLFNIGLRITKNLKTKTSIKIFYILMISMSGALFWELYEFTCDSLFRSNLQEWQTNTKEIFIPLVKERGHGLVDSMMDMTYGITGFFLSMVVYLIIDIYKKP